MTLAEFRERTKYITDEEATNCEIYIMTPNPFDAFKVTGLTGNQQHCWIMSTPLFEYLDYKDLSK